MSDEIVFEEELPSRRPKKPIPPYEINDPIVPDEIDRHYIEKRRDEFYTGRKVIAVIDEPRSCRHCKFVHHRWSSPFWGKASSLMNYHDEPNTKGIYCELVKRKIVTVLDYDDETYKSPWCPLKPMEVVDGY